MAADPIYLDHAATTRPLPGVVAAMAEVHLEHFGNPSSAHGFATGPRRLVDDAREFVRGTLCAAHVVLTSGGTEADALALVGAALARPPGRILAGAADHPAVLCLRPLLDRLGHRLVEVPVDRHGVVTPAALFDLLGPDVRAVAVLHGHNELGSLADVPELVDVTRRVAPDAHVHVDLVQSYGKIDFDLDLSGADSAAISAHKFHGPRGVGALALSSKARIATVVAGGGQEGGLRGGTENVAGAVGMARAAEHCFTGLAAHRAHMEQLAELAFERIAAAVPAVRLGDPARRLPHVLSLRVAGTDAAALARGLAAQGIAVSTGSACHAAGGSPVLRAIGLPPHEAREVLRLSFAFDTACDDVLRAADAIAALALEQTDGRPAGGARR